MQDKKEVGNSNKKNKQFVNDIIIEILAELNKSGIFDYEGLKKRYNYTFNNQTMIGIIFYELLTYIYQRYYKLFDNGKFPDIRFEVKEDNTVNYFIK